MARATYVYCPKARKVVPKGTEYDEHDDRKGPMVIGPLTPFMSPITGEEITSREQLKRHNRAHGVTNAADYSPEWFEKKAKERQAVLNGTTPEARRERVEAIQAAMRNHRR